MLNIALLLELILLDLVNRLKQILIHLLPSNHSRRMWGKGESEIDTSHDYLQEYPEYLGLLDGLDPPMFPITDVRCNQ